MANNTISQIAINGTTYDIRDAAIHSTVNNLSNTVNELLDNKISVFLDSENDIFWLIYALLVNLIVCDCFCTLLV